MSEKADAPKKTERTRRRKVDTRKQILFKQIGAKIAYYRTLRDISQEELAQKAHVSQSALSRIERGKYNDNVSVTKADFGFHGVVKSEPSIAYRRYFPLNSFFGADWL